MTSAIHKHQNTENIAASWNEMGVSFISRTLLNSMPEIFTLNQLHFSDSSNEGWFVEENFIFWNSLLHFLYLHLSQPTNSIQYVRYVAEIYKSTY